MERHNFNQETAQEIIRSSNQSNSLQKWGFIILRCTYTSQSKWDKFLSILRNETLQTLQSPANSDLSATFVLEVIEDAATLDGVDYKVARDRFDAHVTAELQAETDAGTQRKDFPSYITPYQQYFIRITSQPRLGYFIFADQEVVNSVVDASPATLTIEKKRIMQGAGYFIKVVRSAIQEKTEDEMGMDEEEDEEDEGYDVEEDGDSRRELWQKFKAWDLVRVYASLVRGGWPDEHLDMGDGICDVMGL